MLPPQKRAQKNWLKWRKFYALLHIPCGCRYCNPWRVKYHLRYPLLANQSVLLLSNRCCPIIWLKWRTMVFYAQKKLGSTIIIVFWIKIFCRFWGVKAWKGFFFVIENKNVSYYFVGCIWSKALRNHGFQYMVFSLYIFCLRKKITCYSCSNK